MYIFNEITWLRWLTRARPKTDRIAPSKDMHASARGNALPSPFVPVRSHVETKQNGGFGKHIASYTSLTIKCNGSKNLI